MARWVTWGLEWEEKIKSGFYDKLLAEGKISPENRKPEVEPFIFYVDAFSELSTCRPMGEGAIPFTSIADYFNIYGEGEDFEDFIYVIRRMDMAYLEAMDKKRKAKNGPRTTDTKNPNKGGHTRR